MLREKALTLIGISLITLAIVVTAVALFLYPYEPKQPPKADDTGWTQEGVQEVVDANNQFAFDLYSELSKSERGNIFYSPYSIFAAFAMVYEGAKAKTAEEIKSVFYFPDYNMLRPNFAAIYNDINKMGQTYELRTGNALWIQQGYPIFEEYKDRIERYYGGKSANVDFRTETEKSRQTINSFIEEQTNHKIKDLLPKGSINPNTRMILTNAIYFKGTWVWQFDPETTMEMDFKITPKNVVKVPMMYMKPDKAIFNYTDLEKLQILELPYKGEKFSMLIILPKENLDALEPLTAEKLEEWKNKMKETKLDGIYLPKFELKIKYRMEEILSNMGILRAFIPGEAKFSGMVNETLFFIDFVIHQAYVKVDEKGTEAAAATAVSFKIIDSAIPRNIFKVDHPFIFIIQQKDTGNILFLGRVVDPTK